MCRTALRVEVVDPDAGKVVGTISGLHGVHGIAIANDLGKGFITNGQSNSVTIFDLKTLAKSGEPAAGKNPDAVCYEPKTKRVFAINHTGGDATAIDAKTGEVLKTFPIGASAEFCQADGAGKLYVNLESSNEVVEIDAAKNEVTRRTSILPCEGPSGLAIDVKDKKLFSVCDGVMAVTDIPTFKVIATPKIGQGPDAAAFDPALGLAFSSNGADGHAEHCQTGERQVRDGRHASPPSAARAPWRWTRRRTRFSCWPRNSARRRRPRKARRKAAHP